MEHSNWSSLLGALPGALPDVPHPAPANDAEHVSYYAQLEAGARHLAGLATDQSARDEHLRMAAIYRERGLS